MIIEFVKIEDFQVTEDDLNLLEAHIGRILPEDYRRHMIQWNGGVALQDNLVHKDFPSAGTDFVLESLYPLIADDESSTVKAYWDFETGDILAEGYIPIGSAVGGDEIIMSLNLDETFGNIKLQTDYGLIHDISPSFNQYLEDLVEVIS
ncbi:SMI1/KNR4 family protein [Tenacibaculum tangerinum]|uniref:SMI1/KNR4 family protein n=1 Tax=Tenacibaculum tangerinum TaxID=3038772 RepID=A0ABY8L4P2_9FLAO|nr:SMI1/KNR4 family protein [Tenacibaculum tangerinum]WGH75105.1 SMI1/KNR4 family protein [Tenacibaculum tangerinum]